MKIYALIGKSGTGKSFQAVNLCKRLKIESIIDDGLFIAGNRVVAGISAKRQPTKVGAVKTALFHKDEHMEEVRAAIAKTRPDSLLIIGTSDGMVETIAARLGIEEIDERIYIEDITTEEERAVADVQRHKLGKHVIPAPTFQLKHQFSGYFMPPVKILLKEWGSLREASEKSVVRPTYSYMGDYRISDKVFADIVECLRIETKDVMEIIRSSFAQVQEGLEVELAVNMRYGVNLEEAGINFQQRIVDIIEDMTSFNVINIDMEISDIL
ncbi:MAG: Asp23/Gls24 family envelope stress response protein [Firmicutes bacterium]|nr:Asp23/Gls24 family envelope stress response protein [Bacillota bacterium]